MKGLNAKLLGVKAINDKSEGRLAMNCKRYQISTIEMSAIPADQLQEKVYELTNEQLFYFAT